MPRIYILCVRTIEQPGVRGFIYPQAKLLCSKVDFARKSCRTLRFGDGDRDF